MQHASVRAIEAWERVERFAHAISTEMDDITIPHGIPVTDLPRTDPVVRATSTAIKRTRR